MLRRLLGLIKKRGIAIPDADRLAEGEGRTVDVGDPLAGGIQVLLCRVNGVVHALDTACPHAGGRLIKGPLAEGRYAVCPLHNYRFDPRSGAAVEVSCKSATTYRVVERDGQLELFL